MNWNNVSLKDLTENLDSKRIPLNARQRASKQESKLYPYIGANNILCYINEYIFDEEILCVAEDGGSWGRTENCAFIYNEKCWVNNHAHVLISNGKSYLNYLRYYLNYADLNRFITGATRGKLTRKLLDSIKIPIPEKYEDQVRIATILSRVEALIAKRKQTLTLLDDLLKSTFLEMFGDPVNNVKDWKMDSIKNHIGKVITGNTPSRLKMEFYNSKYIEWIKTDNIDINKMYVGTAQEYLSEVGMNVGRTIEKGALLVTCIAGSLKSIGNAALTDRKISFNQQINAIEPFQDVNSLFLYWLFKICKQYVQSVATKGMKKIIIKTEFEKIQMIKPSFILQTQFAQIVEKVESIKAKYEQSLKELENLYGSLSQRAFKGELDLSKVPVELEPESQSVSRFDSADVIAHLPADEKRKAAIKEIDDVIENVAQLNSDALRTVLKDKAFEEPFRFDQIAEAFKKPDFEDVPEYDVVKKVIFNELGNKAGILDQVFDQEEKSIKLKRKP
ncbi:restriction endonuclease subunit S [bacterium]|nr:restriction endonuclease subunit S [bacterium]